LAKYHSRPSCQYRYEHYDPLCSMTPPARERRKFVPRRAKPRVSKAASAEVTPDTPASPAR